VLNVVAPAEPEIDDTVIIGVWLANAVLKSTEPPELTLPLTNLNPALSTLVLLVHPVGALV
jgi:hypothetical protein